MTSATVLHLPVQHAQAPEPAAHRRAASRSVVEFPAHASADDQAHVVGRLQRLLARALAGEVSGLMVVVRDAKGGHSCGAAGCYEREPRDSMVPGILGVINMCQQSGGAA